MPQIEKQMPDSYSGGRETYKNDIFGKIFLKNFDKKMRFRHPFKLVPKIFLPTDLLSKNDLAFNREYSKLSKANFLERKNSIYVRSVC